MLQLDFETGGKGTLDFTAASNVTMHLLLSVLKPNVEIYSGVWLFVLYASLLFVNIINLTGSRLVSHTSEHACNELSRFG